MNSAQIRNKEIYSAQTDELSRCEEKVSDQKINSWLMQNISFMESLSVSQPGCWAEGDMGDTK